MKRKIYGFIAFVAVFVLVASVFDAWLKLTGTWLIFGGALAYLLADFVEKIIVGKP